MKTTFPLTLLILLAAVCRVDAAEGQFDPAKRAATVAPFIDQTTFAVLHADLTRIEVDPLVKTLSLFFPVVEKEQEKARQGIRMFLDTFDRAGCKEAYVVFSLGAVSLRNPSLPVLIIMPVAEDADVEPLMDFSLDPPRGKSREDVVKRIDNLLFFGSPEMIAKLDHPKTDPRPDVEKAFAAAGDRAAQALLIPPAYTGRLVDEMLPTLPEMLGGGSSRVFTRGILWASLAVDLPPELSVRLVIQSEDQRAAEALRDGLAGIFRAVASQERASRQFPGLDAIAEFLTPEVEADQLVLTVSHADGDIAKLLDALQPMLKRSRAMGRRQVSANNLKQLALAMHMYHDQNKCFPAPANYDASGKPLLSWRVHILPYLGHENLYKQFHLDEPWDSEHNAKLTKRRPPVYGSPASQWNEGNRSSFVLPVGEETIAPGGKGIPFSEIKDGTSNTIMIVEVNDHRAPVWTKPEDLPIDLENPTNGLGDLYDGKGFNAAIGDGSVRFLSSSIDPKVLRSLFTRAGGEVVPRDSY